MELHYEVKGEGKTIILLHSGGADLRDWADVVPFLAKQYRVVSMDGRGCGKSPNPDGPSDYVADLRSLMDHLQLDEAIIAGHSMGGQIATEFALEHPNRVNKLVLIAPGLSGYTYSETFTTWMQKIQNVAPDLERMKDIALSSPSYRVVMNSAKKDLMEQMWKSNIAKSFAWGSAEAIWPQPPAIERLHQLTVKTCFMIGTEDVSDLHRIAEQFRVVPDIEFVMITGADHKPTLTHPEVIGRKMMEFLQEE